MRHRYGRASASGWVSGKPSSAQIWAHGKPLVVAKSGRGYTVSVMGSPIVRGPNGLLFQGRVGWSADFPVEKFKTKDIADGVAHKVGHYMLGLGDFVYTYVDHI